MSSMIIFQQSDAVHLVTDGAHYERNGTLRQIGSKVRELPRSNSVFALRGAGAFDIIAPFLEPLETFDQVAAAAPLALEFISNMTTILSPGAPFVERCVELVIAGWSDERQAWSVGLATTLPACDPEDQVGLSHLSGYIQFQPFLAPPLSCAPPIDIQRAVGRACETQAEIDALDPAAAGLAIIEAQRLTPCDLSDEGDGMQYIVGAFAELTTVSAAGIDRRVLQVWPDEIGKLLTPEGAESIEARSAGCCAYDADRQAA